MPCHVRTTEGERHDTYETADNETFFQVCKRMGLKDNEWKMYYMWIVSEFGYGDESSSHPDRVFFDNPYVKSDREERRNRVGAKTIFPRPAGQSWMQIKLRKNAEANMANEEYLAHHAAENELRVMAENIRVQGKSDNDSSAGLRQLLIAMTENDADERLDILEKMDCSDGRVTSEILTVMSNRYESPDKRLSSKRQRGQTRHATAVKNDSVFSDKEFEKYKHIKPGKIKCPQQSPAERKEALKSLMKKYVDSGICDEYMDETGRIRAPDTVRQAKTRKDWPLWEFALKVELSAFKKKHVHSAQVSLSQIREDGFHMRPVPSHIIFDFKYENGINIKPKARWVLAGTPKNMIAMEHYFECFAPAANPDSTRLMQPLAVGRPGLTRAKADVETAFLNSVVPDRERVPVVMPVGMEEFTNDGDKLGFVLLLQGQYDQGAAHLHGLY